MYTFVKKSRIYLSILFVFLFIFSGCNAIDTSYSSSTEYPFQIHFIDVGQADASLILCGEHTLLIDGGNVEDSSLIYSYLNKLGISYLDAVICTHAHEDHVGGLAGALNKADAGAVYAPVTSYDSEAFENFKSATENQGLEISAPPVGDSIAIGDAVVEFLGPIREYSDTNNSSIVVRIIYEDTSFLFTGDAEYESELDILESGCTLKSTVLKVAHHGSDSSTSYVWLREIMPQYAVISVGAGNSYGHPSETVLSRLHDAETEIYRTDMHGTVICSSDGSSVFFSTEKAYAVTSSPVSGGNDLQTSYIGNQNSKKFHLPDCSSVEEMSEKNKVYFNSRQEALDAGYESCGKCNP